MKQYKELNINGLKEILEYGTPLTEFKLSNDGNPLYIYINSEYDHKNIGSYLTLNITVGVYNKSIQTGESETIGSYKYLDRNSLIIEEEFTFNASDNEPSNMYNNSNVTEFYISVLNLSSRFKYDSNTCTGEYDKNETKYLVNKDDINKTLDIMSCLIKLNKEINSEYIRLSNILKVHFDNLIENTTEFINPNDRVVYKYLVQDYISNIPNIELASNAPSVQVMDISYLEECKEFLNEFVNSNLNLYSRFNGIINVFNYFNNKEMIAKKIRARVKIHNQTNEFYDIIAINLNTEIEYKLYHYGQDYKFKQFFDINVSSYNDIENTLDKLINNIYKEFNQGE